MITFPVNLAVQTGCAVDFVIGCFCAISTRTIMISTLKRVRYDYVFMCFVRVWNFEEQKVECLIFEQQQVLFLIFEQGGAISDF